VDPNVKGKSDWTPIEIAATSGIVEMV